MRAAPYSKLGRILARATLRSSPISYTMASFRTEQERVDALTMKIEKPTVGSGYIEHPPQVPFQARIISQPGTSKPEEVPEWFAGQGGRGGGHHPGRHPHGSGRGGGGGGGGQSHQQRQNPHQQPRPAHYASGHTQKAPPQQYQQARPAPQANGHYSHQPGASRVQCATTPQIAPAPRQTAPPRPAPVAPRPAAQPSPPHPNQEDDKKLSKAQKAKLRKKLREGKA